MSPVITHTSRTNWTPKRVVLDEIAAVGPHIELRTGQNEIHRVGILAYVGDAADLGGNKVSFNDDPNVRGRLGVRVGTSMQVWTGTTMEPFVIGSLWGNLSDNNQATLVSTGTSFHLEDNLQDVWGEVSAGVNFFNPSANTSVFAKLDVTFGDNVDGVGGKAGMRVSW